MVDKLKQLTPEEYEICLNLIGDFDFEEAEKIMDCIDHKWYIDGVLRVPEAHEIRERITIKLIDTIVGGRKEEYCSVSGGGYECKKELLDITTNPYSEYTISYTPVAAEYFCD